MAADALEEKINKIRQQNEEIRRRHEEVEEDKKNAAKLNALVQMVPSTDWPERKEPPEFSNPPRVSNKSKSAKEHHEYPQQYHVTIGEGRKVHTFAEGQGPPPDPKYNFLADSEREMSNTNSNKDNPSKGQKYSRDIYKRKSGGKDVNTQKNHKTNRVSHRDEYQPEYEAWRAERNRIDEDRISRQRTAEGNWRREWDNDKAHIVNELSKHEAKLGEYVRKDYKDFDRKHHLNGNDYTSYNRGGNFRSYRGSSRHFHNYENRSKTAHHRNGHIKNPLSLDSEERNVIATDQNVKVTLNQGNVSKGPVMSVKVNSPSIAGTGRVGPRQRGRVTYSSHSDVEVTSSEIEPYARPKSFEDRSKGIYHDNLQKFSNARKTPSQLKKNFNSGNKASYPHKKEIIKENAIDNSQKHEVLKECKEPQEFSQTSKSLKLEENNAMSLQMYSDPKETDIIVPDVKDVKLENEDKQNDCLNICINVSEKNDIYPEVENDSVSNNSDLCARKPETEIEKCTVITTEDISESQITEEIATLKHEIITADLTISCTEKTNNTKNEMQSIVSQLCDVNDDTKDAVIENKEQNSTTETFKDAVNYNCDNTLCEDKSEQENNVNTNTFINENKANEVMIPSSTYVCSIDEKDNKLQSDNQALKREEIVTDEITVIDEKIDTDRTQDVIISNNKIQERTSHDNIEEKNDEAAIGEMELPKEDETKEKTTSNKVIENQ